MSEHRSPVNVARVWHAVGVCQSEHCQAVVDCAAELARVVCVPLTPHLDECRRGYPEYEHCPCQYHEYAHNQMMVPGEQEVDQPQRVDNVDCTQPQEPEIPSAPESHSTIMHIYGTN